MILATPPATAGLPEPRELRLAVAEVEEAGPSLRRIRLQGEDLRGLSHLPGQDLMLRLALKDGRAVNRRYTIRRLDREKGFADLLVALHGDGPAASWARAAGPGQPALQVVGPRGKITLDGAAGWHLFLGDETYIPGTLAMLEALPEEVPAVAALEIAEPGDEQPLPSGAEVSWLCREGGTAGDPTLLLGFLEGWQRPAGAGHAYIAAELRVALRLRDQLLALGMPRESISAKGYWVMGRANADRGEPDEPASP